MFVVAVFITVYRCITIYMTDEHAFRFQLQLKPQSCSQFLFYAIWFGAVRAYIIDAVVSLSIPDQTV